MKKKGWKLVPILLAGAVLAAGCGSTGEEESAAQETVTGWETIPAQEIESQNETTAQDASETSASGASESEDAAAAETNSEQAEEAASQSTEEALEAGTASSEAAEAAVQEDAQSAVFSGTLADSVLADSIRQVMADYGLNSSNFSISYENLQTGESLYWNELTIMTPASTYKLPLNMYYYDMQAEGLISGDDIIEGTELTLNECHYKSLVLSDNPSSQAMLADISFSDFRQHVRNYFTLSDSEIGDTYWHRNFYSTRMMADIAVYLYQHSGDYSEAIGYLKEAMPGMYFKRYITDCEIAQKYGSLDGYENCVGIVYGKTPFSLCVYTYGQSEDLVGQIAKIVYDFEEAQ